MVESCFSRSWSSGRALYAPSSTTTRRNHRPDRLGPQRHVAGVQSSASQSNGRHDPTPFERSSRLGGSTRLSVVDGLGISEQTDLAVRCTKVIDRVGSVGQSVTRQLEL